MGKTRIASVALSVIMCLTLWGCEQEIVVPNPFDTSSTVTPGDDPGDTPVVVSNGKFSVSDSRQVMFSPGNLQYKPSTNSWRVAPHQYECIGADNASVSASYAGWIDLFGWGTSGWNSGANAYQPYSISTTSSDYIPGGSATNGLTGSCANADWGVYNVISNISPTSGWRTLTKDEWAYLIGSSAKRLNKWGEATINSTYRGLILLPDDWTPVSDIPFTPGYGSEYNTNFYTLAQWNKLEEAGAIFLPAAGYRVGSTVYSVGTYGYYWSSTAQDESYSFGFNFYVSYITAAYPLFRDYGRSVRLVHDR